MHPPPPKAAIACGRTVMPRPGALQRHSSGAMLTHPRAIQQHPQTIVVDGGPNTEIRPNQRRGEREDVRRKK